MNMLVMFSSGGTAPGAKVAAIRPSQASERNAAVKKNMPAIPRRGSLSENCAGSAARSNDIMLRMKA